MTLTDLLLWLPAVLLLVPLAVLTVECLAALLPCQAAPAHDGGERPPCAVLVPAHDEEQTLPQTLAELWPQLFPGDRLLVIADNCTDRTAAVARTAGADVIERRDAQRRGKGYALAFGVDSLRAGLPAVVVVIDADCRVPDGCLDRLVRTVAATGRPVQAAYTLDPPPGAGPRSRLSAYAFRFKNLVRPLGLHRLGLPCLLTGSGMAFPWTALRDAPLASGNIVEDLRLGIDLAVAGFAPLFEPLAQVGGELPAGRRAAQAQRRRWEHGHLRTLLTQVPRLLSAAVRQRRADLIGLATEVGVPPLSVLTLLWIIGGAVTLGGWAGGASAGPVLLVLAAGGVAFSAALAAWVKYGRTVLPPAALLAAPWYILAKLPIYLGFLVRPQRAWVRTERNQPARPAGPPPVETAL